jgi:hypothetical protein
LVTVDEGQIEQVAIRPTDVLRWHRVEIELAESDGLAEIYERVRQALETCHDSDDGRFTAVRLTIVGACAAHAQLVRQSQREEAIAQIRNVANDIDEVWVEKIELHTSAPVDLEQLRKGSDLIGDLLRQVQLIAQDDGQLQELARALQPLADKAARELDELDDEAEIELDGPEPLRRWLAQAEALLVARLTEAAP